MFTWRIAHNSLALRSNLQRRGVKLDDINCLFCGRSAEDGAHLFVKCKHAKEVWRHLGFENVRQKLETADSARETLEMIWTLPERERLQILTSWWHWWNNRNKLREGELLVSCVDIVRRGISQADEFLEMFSNSCKKMNADPHKWRPPEGVLKIN